MNKEQVEMLSVKSAVERTITSFMASIHGPANRSEYFFDEVNRYVAGLYASRQIDRDYSVAAITGNKLEIRFSTKGHNTFLAFTSLPAHLCPPKPIPLVKPEPRRPVDKKDPIVAEFLILTMSVLKRLPIAILNSNEINAELAYRVQPSHDNKIYKCTFQLEKVQDKKGDLIIKGLIHLQPYADSCTLSLPITLSV